ncbi:hypothetical protein M3484_00885 [Pseudomonas sp. GX19020]|uniref:hypothetical protein n=1 Tax=Pseudomonas sp. GX19020 TaxID=2942277 RepID=UPI002019AF5E|nr:hypothetical protein [Pseudomonas sp. GX19020]MCL4065131.1 hypothetical protein [Pseudomonas sp. GX19020]
MEIYNRFSRLQHLTREAVRLAQDGALQDLNATLAELQALAHRFTALPDSGGRESLMQREARRLREEEEIEQRFDNMPV